MNSWYHDPPPRPARPSTPDTRHGLFTLIELLVAAPAVARRSPWATKARARVAQAGFTLIELLACQPKQARRARRQAQAAFTLIELLVVVAVIAILAAMLLPALSRAKEKSVRLLCLNNQKQAYLALALYAGDYEEYPAARSRQWILANWNADATGEVVGYGFFGFSDTGPWRLLRDGKYLGYAQLQCSIRPGFAIAEPRRNFSPFYPWFADRELGQGLWYNYNGPTAAGGRLINYNHNHCLDVLGGHWTNWTAGEAGNTWGLSARDASHDCRFNQYRRGGTALSDVAFLNCISVIKGSDSAWWNDHLAEFEPHEDTPASCVPPFNQTGGGASMPVRRNYTFGDGHGIYIHRDNRNFTTADSF